METCSVVLTFECVDKVPWCDHLNETSLAAPLHGTICFSLFLILAVIKDYGDAFRSSGSEPRKKQ